jgi:hypothetical protein
MNSDATGTMIIGVINRKLNNSKLIGSTINYSHNRGMIRIRILLDANKKKMTIFTPNNPQGEVFADLPKDGVFYPSIQNKSKIIAPNTLRIDFKFELVIPTDRNMIPTTYYSSDGEGAEETNFEDISMIQPH